MGFGLLSDRGLDWDGSGEDGLGVSICELPTVIAGLGQRQNPNGEDYGGSQKVKRWTECAVCVCLNAGGVPGGLWVNFPPLQAIWPVIEQRPAGCSGLTVS